MPNSVLVSANIFVVRVRDGYKYIAFGIDGERARALVHQGGHREPPVDQHEAATFATSDFAIAGYLASASAFSAELGATRTLSARHYVLLPPGQGPRVADGAIAALKARHTGTMPSLIERVSEMTESEAREALTGLCFDAVDVPDGRILTAEDQVTVDLDSMPAPPTESKPPSDSWLPRPADVPRHAPASSVLAWLPLVLMGAGILPALLLFFSVVRGSDNAPEQTNAVGPSPSIGVPPALSLPMPTPGPLPIPTSAPVPAPVKAKAPGGGQPPSGSVQFRFIGIYPDADAPGRVKVVVEPKVPCQRASLGWGLKNTLEPMARMSNSGRFYLSGQIVEEPTFRVVCLEPKGAGSTLEVPAFASPGGG